MINLRALQRAFDLVAYLKQYDPNAKEYGPNIAVRDPVCGKEQKLWVLISDKADGTKAGAYVCYYCGDGGKQVLDLIKRVEDMDIVEAVGILTSYQKNGRPLADLRALVQQTLDGVAPTEVWDEKPPTPIDLPDEFVPALKLLPYFKERGITLKRARRYNLGFCAGGYFDNRLVVPVSIHGAHSFFVARYMGKPPLGVKKTLYPKGARPGRVLFNYDRARLCERIVIVEDVFSAMQVGKCGVATFGTTLSQYQLELLMKTAASEIVVMWDRDAIVKAHELAVRLAEFWSVRVVELPDARDPDEWSRKDHRRMIAAAPVMDASAAFASSVRSRL